MDVDGQVEIRGVTINVTSGGGIFSDSASNIRISNNSIIGALPAINLQAVDVCGVTGKKEC